MLTALHRAVELIRREILKQHPEATGVNAVLTDFYLYDLAKEREAAGKFMHARMRRRLPQVLSLQTPSAWRLLAIRASFPVTSRSGLWVEQRQATAVSACPPYLVGLWSL